MTEPELTRARWHKSTRSAQDGACVEVSTRAGQVAVRDSKARAGTVLLFSPAAWTAFLEGIRRGEFDLS